MAKTADRENLRYRYLSETEIDFIARNHPEVESFGFCPTCNGTGLYTFRGSTPKKCDCELQRQLYKHYLSAGIPVSYQRLDWKDFNGPKEVLASVNEYMKDFDKYVASSIGIFLTGSNGIGKTFVLTLMLKDLVCMGYKCFFITADEMFSMKTDGWKDETEKSRFNTKVKNSKILVIDDAGKEFSNRLTDQTFESLIRYRSQNSLTTFISSNRSLKETRASHGESFYSLITGSFITHEIHGEDYRPTDLKNRMAEIKKEWTRPIL